MRLRPAVLLGLLLRAAAASAADAKPPETRQQPVVETLHGVPVSDPYRWLEDQQSPETRAWIDAQNAYTASVLDPLPGRERIERRLSELFKIDTVSTPFVRGGRYFFSRRAADQDLSVLYVRKSRAGADEVLLDPHGLTSDHTMSVTFLDVTPDGKTVVYGVRDGGQDELLVRVMDVDSRQNLADSLPKARYSGVSLTPDKKSIYYSRQTKEGPRVFVHAMGSDSATDTQLFGDGYGPEKGIGCNISDDGRYLTINVFHGSAARKTELYYKDLKAGSALRTIVNDVEAVFGGPIGGDTLFMRTNWKAPNWRILAVDLKDPARERWREILPERKDAVLASVSTAGHRLFVASLENVQSRLRVYEATGKLVREVQLPSIGSLGAVSGDFDQDEAFYAFSSLARPTTVYRYETASGKSEEWARLKVPVDGDSVEIQQVFYASKDGTPIPMFVAHKKGLGLDGQRPTLLTGYGGFNLSQSPSFSQRAVFWIENGGVFALANMRGGGEYGEAWHRAGMLENKQNVFDDFIGAAEYLISHKYTSKERLAISGGSNGGLLVGAALTQRPDLFAAVVCTNPLLDMLRYHKFFVAGYWVPEYGSSEDAAQFEYIYKYSPYHRVKAGEKYPAVLFNTGDGDTRVAPLHARKMAGLVQASSSSGKPVLLRYDTKAGHSAGMPVSKTIHDLTDEMRFLFWQLGVAESAIAPAAAGSNGTNGKRSITETDLFRFVWIADPQISPDGRQVAFVRVSVDAKKEGYDTALFTVSTSGGEPRRFTAGPRDLSPRWSPDGKWLAFLRAPEKDGRPQPAQIHLIGASGGEAWAITDLPRGAGPPTWSPDGARLLFSSQTTADDIAKKNEKPDPAKRQSDVRVVARAIYRFNGPGYIDPTRHGHVWTLDIPKAAGELAKPKQVTSGDFDEQNAAWSPDGREVYFTSSHVKEAYYEQPKVEIFKVAADGGDPVKMISMDGAIGDFSFSPDGKRLAFRGIANPHPPQSYTQPDLFVVDNAVGALPRNLTAGYDFDISGGLTGDQRAPRGGSPSEAVWSRDGRAILTTTGEKGRANVMKVDASTGKVEPFTSGDQEVMAYTATPEATKFAVVVSTPTNIGDLYAGDANGKLTRLTDLNKDLLSEIHLTPPEEMWVTSFDGKKIHSFVQKPPDFDPSKKYPLILNIHGGPHAAYGYTFDHEFQWMAAKGYVVIYPNPRGSTTYGQDFGNIIQFRYPGDDYKDLMACVDAAIKGGYVDATKLGVTGGSGGGVLTNWTITQTDRFAAAVSQRSIADWSGFWYTADFTLFQPTWFRAAPWEDPKDFAARSAITFINKVKTPLMLIEGESDMRTPPADGGEQMFRALKYRKIPTVMVRFPGETHELSRSGQPWHRVERLQHIVGWFDAYLQGKKTDAYDVK